MARDFTVACRPSRFLSYIFFRLNFKGYHILNLYIICVFFGNRECDKIQGCEDHLLFPLRPCLEISRVSRKGTV